MAEKEDILEETEDADDGAEQAKKGLSTALLIKVAIGLAVLLIVLAVTLFFFTSTETDTPDDNTEATQTEQTDDNDDSADIDLASTTDNDNATTDTDVSMNASTAEKALTQILELQQQLTELKAENQKLNKNIEELTTENNDLKKQSDTLSQKTIDSELPLEQLVNTPDLPRDYRRDDYANSPKFELEPKWGEFKTSTKTK